MKPATLSEETARAVLDGANVVKYSPEWLRVARETTGVSQAWFARQIAKRSGVPCRQQTVDAWERRGTTPNEKHFGALLEVLTEELDQMGHDTSKVLVERM